MRAASQRLNTLVMVARTQRRRHRRDQESISRSTSDRRISDVVAQHALEASCAEPAWKLSSSVPKFGIAAATTSVPMIAAHSTSRPTGYHSTRRRRRWSRPAARAAPDSRATRPAGRSRPGTAMKKTAAESDGKPPRSQRRGDQPGQMAPAERGDQDRQRREIEQQDRRRASRTRPTRTAAPPPRRLQVRSDTICIIASCPASSAVRGGSTSAPTIGRRQIALRPRHRHRRSESSPSVSGSRKAASRGSARA